MALHVDRCLRVMLWLMLMLGLLLDLALVMSIREGGIHIHSEEESWGVGPLG